MASPKRWGAVSSVKPLCRDTLTATGRMSCRQKYWWARKTVPKAPLACTAANSYLPTSILPSSCCSREGEAATTSTLSLLPLGVEVLLDLGLGDRRGHALGRHLQLTDPDGRIEDDLAEVV